MDPRQSAQDVLRCHLCETPVPPSINSCMLLMETPETLIESKPTAVTQTD